MSEEENKKKNEKFFSDQIEAASLARKINNEDEWDDTNYLALRASLDFHMMFSNGTVTIVDVINTAKKFEKFLNK